MRPSRILTVAAVACALVTSCSGPSPRPVPVRYYLALGDSLAVGVQPDAAGASVPTAAGYPDQLLAMLGPAQPGLRLVKLGCPGETTATMITGGTCRYAAGSQLAAAVRFLRAHRGQVLLVTIDIGANDPERCGQSGTLGAALSCAAAAFPGAAGRLEHILSSLRAAAGPGVRLAGMNYYLPALRLWRDGFLGEQAARLIGRLTASYNQRLEQAYATYGVPVADVYGAFGTADFGDARQVPGMGLLPRNVALLCQWTWECAAPPRGPNQHPDTAGYAVIAAAFRHAVNLG